MIGASAALTICRASRSWARSVAPASAYVNGEYVHQPAASTRCRKSKLDLVVAGTQDAVLMVESEADELSEEDMLNAVMFGHREMQKVIEAIIRLAERSAKEPCDHHAGRQFGPAREGPTTSPRPICKTPSRPLPTRCSVRRKSPLPRTSVKHCVASAADEPVPTSRL
jgi:hypothetical protein